MSFRVKENRILTTGHKTRFWCCQDEDRKQKNRPSEREHAKHRDTLGMNHFKCKSALNIICRSDEINSRITIWLEHRKKHTPYYDVTLPPEAAAMIREDLEWTSPNDIVKKVQNAYPAVTASQVYKAWTTMSESLWKREAEQLPSVKALLGEYKDDVDVLDVPVVNEVEQIAWAMKKIVGPLKGKIVEIGIDATCKSQLNFRSLPVDRYDLDNTNAKHLELYTVLREYDNSGFPLSYCLLSTASSIDERKRMRALGAWAVLLRDQYGVLPKFVHTDKDMAEIGMSRQVWKESKHQLCWWHQREALKRRFKGNLPTTPYNVKRARQEYRFIDATFKPYGRADPKDIEGTVPGERHESEAQNDASDLLLTGEDPNAIKIRIPILLSQVQSESQERRPPSAIVDKSTPLMIQIPVLATVFGAGATAEDETDEEIANERRTFCPVQHRTTVIEMMERHFCAHPLIPGYSAPNPEGIRAWAVKQIYEFCVDEDLPNLWAYLWENWYRRGRWELWARCGNPEEIPRLKTTMMVEAQSVISCTRQ